MMKTFIGGSRRYSRIPFEALSRIEDKILSEARIIIGDANGADKAVQGYLDHMKYGHVKVFFSGTEPRNNVGGWPICSVRPAKSRKDYQFYAAKDRAMAKEADEGLMYWDGKSFGALMNALRLVQQNKLAILYCARSKEFVEIESMDDWNSFQDRVPAELKDRIDEEESRERNVAALPLQLDLL